MTIVKGLSYIGITGVTTAFVTKAIYVLALTSANAIYSRRQLKKAMRSAASLDQGRTLMVRQPAAPREIVYGTVRKSGVLVFAHVTGTTNEFLHIVVALAGHQVQAIGDIYIDDVIVPLDGGGNASSGKYVGFLRVKKHLGADSQTADSDLVSEASSVWTTNHRLRGIAYVYVRLKYNQDVFPGGIPNVSAIIQGRLVLDTRTSATAFSANWALCLRDYMAFSKLGLGVPDAEFDTTALNAAANVADENVNLNPSGTEKRYTINGVISTDAQPGEIIETMASAGAGFVSYIGGKWIIQAGAYRTPTITLDESDLRGPLSVQTKVSRRDIFNGVKGVFTSPINEWQTADFPPVVNATYTTADGGVRIWQDVELPFTTSAATAQRIAKIALERVRQEIVVKLPCKLTALRVQAGDNVMLTNARLGWSAKVFEVQSFSFAPEPQEGGALGLGVDLMLRETAAGVWDWNDGEETIVDLAPNTNLPNPFSVAAPTSLVLTSGTATKFLQPDGTTVPRLKATWTVPADEFVQSGGLIRVQYKTDASSIWSDWSVVTGTQTEEYITDVLIGTAYSVRVRSENTTGVSSVWTTVTGHTVAGDTTAPAAPTSLTATSGAGFISLSWAQNTEADLSEYGVYRNTSNSFAGSTKLAEVLANRFIDASASPGTAYWYFVTAFDRSENESTESASATATASAPINNSAPSTPSAPTFNAEGTYIAGDGSIFAFIVVNTPALPSGAIANDILYRVNGSGSWIIADQQAGASTARIDDLSPGVAYEFAVRSISSGGALSTVSSTLSRTAPNKTSGPATPSGLTAAGTLESITLSWSANTEADFRQYQIFRNTSNSIPGSPYAQALTTEFVDTDVAASTLYYYWLKAVNRSGVASSETASVNATRVEQSAAGGFLLDVSGASSGNADNSTVYTALSGSVTGLGDLRRHDVVFILRCPLASPEDVTSSTITLKRGVTNLGSDGTGIIVANGPSQTVSFTIFDVIPAGSQSYTVEIEALSTGGNATYNWESYLKIY
jgi:fibronectin type 3 domain-containing protein